MAEERCKTCRYWQDWHDRVSARVSMGYNEHMGGGVYELRICRNIPAPALRKEWNQIYTDENFGCSSWEPIKK